MARRAGTQPAHRLHSRIAHHEVWLWPFRVGRSLARHTCTMVMAILRHAFIVFEKTIFSILFFPFFPIPWRAKLENGERAGLLLFYDPFFYFIFGQNPGQKRLLFAKNHIKSAEMAQIGAESAFFAFHGTDIPGPAL